MLGEIKEVTCAIIRQEGKILVVQRSDSMPHPQKWEFPGGKIKTGESPEKCIRREIREELSINVKVEALLPTVVHTYGDITIRLLPFICSVDSGRIILTEHSCYKWMDPDQLELVDLLDADKLILPYLEGGERAA